VNQTRVLVVDDHAIVRQGIRMLLDTEPSIQVVGEAGDGKEAVQKAVELQPDVVLMDLVMPGGGGLEATAEIKRLLPEAKVIILTGFNEKARAERAVRIGADGYLLKDIGGAELIKAIQAVQQGGMPLDPKIASLVLRNVEGGTTRPDLPRLTAREQRILRLLASGLSNKTIAETLNLRPGTVKVHISNILHKLHMASRTEAAIWAMQRDSDLPDTINPVETN